MSHLCDDLPIRPTRRRQSPANLLTRPGFGVSCCQLAATSLHAKGEAHAFRCSRFCSFRLATAAREVAGTGIEETSLPPVQKRHFLRFLRISVPPGPDGCRFILGYGQPNRKRSDGPQADNTRRDRTRRLPLCHAATFGHDQLYQRVQGRAFARIHPQTIRLALRYQKDSGSPAPSCRRASARS